MPIPRAVRLQEAFSGPLRALGAVLALVALQGCGGGHDAKTSYVARFRGDATDLGPMQAAVAEWEGCGGVTVAVVGPDDPRTSDFDVDAVSGLIDDEPPSFGCPCQGTTTPGLIRYFTTGVPEADRAVFAHELGHAFGLGHVPEVGPIMHPDIGVDSHVTASDCSALAAR